MEVVLTIAGSDSSAGAGIQQDLKTITAHGCYGATVITSVTSQNTLGVQSAMAVPPAVVASQISAVLTDLEPAAIKIGMIPDKAVAEAIVDILKPYLQQHPVPVVYDPVMVSTSGFYLMQPDAIEYIATHLFPLCTLITPNLPEAERLGDSLKPYAYLLKGEQARPEISHPAPLRRRYVFHFRHYLRLRVVERGSGPLAGNKLGEQLRDLPE